MTTTYTPGPWKFRAVTEHETGGNLIALLLETEQRPMPANDPCVMAVRGDWMNYLFRMPQGKANARLIAAAPELLEALRRMLMEHGHMGKAAEMALAAMRKAEGE